MAQSPSVANQSLQELLAYPREDLGIEIKSWLDLAVETDKACLAQALIALANHGGGRVVIGLIELNGTWQTATPRPQTLQGYSQDGINGIVAGYAEPGFHCEVQHVSHPTSGELFPIITVPGNHSAPIRSKRDGPQDGKNRPQHVAINTYYIRRPGPTSEAPRTGQEWDQLIRRCIKASKEDLVGTIARLLNTGVVDSGSLNDDPWKTLASWREETLARWKQLVDKSGLTDRFKYGTWNVVYTLDSITPPTGLESLLQVLRRVEGSETGWPVWWCPSKTELEPYPFDKTVECWMVGSTFEDAAHSDLWRATPDGRMALVRGYQEDSGHQNTNPGTVLDLTIPVWRVGECLLHASRLAEALGNPEALVRISFQWKGLKGRSLQAWASPNRILGGGYTSRQDEATSSLEVPASQIPADLVNLVSKATLPLFEVFKFFNPPTFMVSEEVEKMRTGRS